MTNPEKIKYEQMWALPSYRKFSPGARLVPTFLETVQPPAGSFILDFGCGSGRAAVLLTEASFRVTLVDFVATCRNPEARGLPFIEADLEHPIPATAEYGYCCDVMEHIPEENVHRVLDNLFQATPRIFFSIARFLDGSGDAIGEVLHITVRSHRWWEVRLSMHGTVQWQQDAGKSSLFYVVRYETP